jgi:hypothetical protein
MFPTRFLPILFALLSPFAQAAAPSGETWFTISTPNFRVHHTAPLEAYARHYAFSLERALPLIEKRLNWKAPTPVDIVVMDTSDSANGLAMNFPNTHIEVFSTPFEHDSPLTYYFDWVDELAVHELTHIVANDSALGFYLTLRSIFGSWVKPNGLQPSWMIEGLAVYNETSFSPAGRGRSPWLNALLGEAAREGKLTDPSYTSLDRFNDGNPWWPGGATPYLLGYTIQSLAAEKSADAPGALSYNNSGLIPFMPDRNVEEVTGKDWATIWGESNGRLAKIFPKGSAEAGCYLTNSGRQTGGHALSPDGWVYFSEENFDRGFWLSRVRADAPCGSADVERLFFKKWGGPSHVAVSEDGKTVAFSAFHLQKFEHTFSDIYLWNVEDESYEQITDSLRARDPAFAGPYLFYVYQKSDTSQAIRRRTLASGEETDIYTAKPLERVATLHARGGTVVFSHHDNNGQEKILALSVNGGEAKALLTEKFARTHERNPYLAPNGDLYFAGAFDKGPGNRANAQAIYRVKDGKAQAAYTNASGFSDRPILLPDGKTMLVQQYHLGGMDLARVEINNHAPQQADDLHEMLTGEKPHYSAAPTEQELAGLGESRPYSATSTPATSLWPQYWMPEILAAQEGYLIGASTSGNDPLEYHRYGIIAQYDSRASFPVYRAFYMNRSQATHFFFEAQQTNSYFASTDVSQRNSTYSAQAIVPIGQAFYAFGGAFQERALFGSKGQSVVIFQNLAYDRTGKTPSAMDLNFGESLSAYLGIYPNAKNEKLFVDMRPRAALYRRGFAPSHSVSLEARAGISTNKLLASNYYLGGGLSVLDGSDFVVRGYPLDTLLGQRIVTANFAYTLPVLEAYRGLGTNPIFLEDIGLRFLADAGTANFLGAYRGNTFMGYLHQELGKKILTGAGLDLVTKGSIFYHVPVTLLAGAHYGFSKEFGGEGVFFLGFSSGLSKPVAKPAY